MTLLEERVVAHYSDARWRVTVYLDGKPYFYNVYAIERLADQYAHHMRQILAEIPGVFVKKEQLV